MIIKVIAGSTIEREWSRSTIGMTAADLVFVLFNFCDSKCVAFGTMRRQTSVLQPIWSNALCFETEWSKWDISNKKVLPNNEGRLTLSLSVLDYKNSDTLLLRLPTLVLSTAGKHISCCSCFRLCLQSFRFAHGSIPHVRQAISVLHGQNISTATIRVSLYVVLPAWLNSVPTSFVPLLLATQPKRVANL